MLETGIKGRCSEKVTAEKTAAALGSGALDVYATPAMIALMENTAMKSVAAELEDGMTTVGTKLDIAHTSASPVGSTITCESELTGIDRRRLVFRVTAYDDAGEIGSGTHERFIVDAAKFTEKTQAKLQK
ncbi:MAG: thioesterase family protein [Ruminiclostridium sp.]|nr:thioesterase family protein [Ruminiclostridium sp.]